MKFVRALVVTAAVVSVPVGVQVATAAPASAAAPAKATMQDAQLCTLCWWIISR